MNIEEYRDYCLMKSHVTEETPFGKLSTVLVFKVAGKMFSATDMETYESISVKHYPEKIEELRARYPAVKIPAYMSKKHWNRVDMDGSIPDQLIREWIDISYQLVVKNLSKKLQKEILGE